MISYRLKMRVKPTVEKSFRGEDVMALASILKLQEVAYNSTFHWNLSELSWSPASHIFNINEVDVGASRSHKPMGLHALLQG